MKQEAAEVLHSWVNDPLKFANDVFSRKPREVQPQILEAIGLHNRVSVSSCRDLGKSSVAAMAALWWMSTRPNSLVYSLAPRWSQIHGSLWAEIRDLFFTSPVLPKLYKDWEVLAAEIKVPDRPRWRAVGFASNEMSNLEGFHGDDTLVIIDEAKAVPDEFFSSLHGMTTRPTDKIFCISTPGAPQGFFHKTFSDPDYKTFQISAWDIPRLVPHAEAELKRLGPNNPFYRQQVLGEFTGADTNGFIPLSMILLAVNRPIEPEGRKVVSLDCAGKGADENVLTRRQGDVIVSQEVWHGDEMATAARCVELAKQFDASQIIVDEHGIGAGIRSRVMQIAGPGVQVIGFNAAHSPHNVSRFANKKAEVAEALRLRFVNGDISIPDDQKLIEQLASWQMGFSAQGGKTKIIDPDVSPDRADSLLMSFAYDGGLGLRTTTIRGI
jgi:hypothetical protein